MISSEPEHIQMAIVRYCRGTNHHIPIASRLLIVIVKILSRRPWTSSTIILPFCYYSLQTKKRQRHYLSMMYNGKQRVEEVVSTPTSSTRPSPPFLLHPRIVLCYPNQTLRLVPVAVHSAPLPLSLLTPRPRQGCKINVTPPGNSFTRSPSNQPTNQFINPPPVNVIKMTQVVLHQQCLQLNRTKCQTLQVIDQEVYTRY